MVVPAGSRPDARLGQRPHLPRVRPPATDPVSTAVPAGGSPSGSRPSPPLAAAARFVRVSAAVQREVRADRRRLDLGDRPELPVLLELPGVQPAVHDDRVAGHERGEDVLREPSPAGHRGVELPGIDPRFGAAVVTGARCTPRGSSRPEFRCSGGAGRSVVITVPTRVTFVSYILRSLLVRRWIGRIELARDAVGGSQTGAATVDSGSGLWTTAAAGARKSAA